MVLWNYHLYIAYRVDFFFFLIPQVRTEITRAYQDWKVFSYLAKVELVGIIEYIILWHSVNNLYQTDLVVQALLVISPTECCWLIKGAKALKC